MTRKSEREIEARIEDLEGTGDNPAERWRLFLRGEFSEEEYRDWFAHMSGDQ